MGKLNEARAKAMREFYQEHPQTNISEVASIFGVSRQCAWYILRGSKKHPNHIGRPRKAGLTK